LPSRRDNVPLKKYVAVGTESTFGGFYPILLRMKLSTRNKDACYASLHFLNLTLSLSLRRRGNSFCVGERLVELCEIPPKA